MGVSGYKCKECHQYTTLLRSQVLLDEVHKEYECPDGHKTTIVRYGDIIEIRSPRHKTKKIHSVG